MMNLVKNPSVHLADHWSFEVTYYRPNLEPTINPTSGTNYVMVKNCVVNNELWHYGCFSSSDTTFEISVLPGGSCIHIHMGGLSHSETQIYKRKILNRGSLSYIDNGTNTTAINPRRRGEPVINYVHFPAGMTQTLHTHPSQRIGLVLKGNGRVELQDGNYYYVNEGEGFYMERLEVHNFITENEDVVLFVWAPDSDAGASDSDNALLNRTYVGQR